MKTTVKKYLKLGRITSWPSFSLSFVIIFAVGAYEGTSWTEALIGFVALFLFAGFAFALNFYSDRESDIYHDGKEKEYDLSKQPLITGEVTERECIAFCVVTFLAAIALGFVVSNLFGWLMVSVCLVGGVLYSHPWIRLKAKPVVDVVCMAAMAAILFSAGYALARGTMLNWPAFLFLYMFAAISHIPSVLYDYKYDAQAGLRTSAVVFGQRNLAKAMWVLWLCILPLAWFIISEPYAFGYKVAVVLGCASLAIYTSTVWWSLRTPSQTVPLLTGHPRREIAFSSVVSLSSLCYACFRLFSAS